MNLLLDTHIALWALIADKRLSRAAIDLIADAENSVFVSAASIWEIAIKHALRPAALPISGAQALAAFETAGYVLLSISPQHAAAVETLAPIHADPFDRMLLAQAICEPMRLLSRDRILPRYGAMVVAV